MYVGVELGRFGEEGLEIYFGVNLLLELLLRVAGEPANDGVDFGFGAAFFLSFLDVKWVDASEGHLEDAGVGFHGLIIYQFRTVYILKSICYNLATNGHLVLPLSLIGESKQNSLEQFDEFLFYILEIVDADSPVMVRNSFCIKESNLRKNCYAAFSS